MLWEIAAQHARPRPMTVSRDPSVPRLAPRLSLPPYAYVPGRFPHPTRDPDGHRCTGDWDEVSPPDPVRWSECEPYLYGLDLFNRGYYWEAHEAWEGLWQACGRHGPVADFLHGLIHLAAAGVKAREGRIRGVRSQARRAADMFRATLHADKPAQGRYMGLSLDALTRFADGLAESGEATGAQDSSQPPLALVLVPA